MNSLTFSEKMDQTERSFLLLSYKAILQEAVMMKIKMYNKDLEKKPKKTIHK